MATRLSACMRILGYDLRGGTGTAMSLASQSRHPLVLELGVRQALMHLTELRLQTSIGRCNVQSISLDPRDSTRMAFHLASGWSGKLLLPCPAICPGPTDPHGAIKQAISS